VTHIVVDPITRIEGHLRIEAEVEPVPTPPDAQANGEGANGEGTNGGEAAPTAGRITEAHSASTMFRGIEIILKGRDPRDAWAFAQRICGVCTTVHAMASVRAVEDAIGVNLPPNARILRNLIASSQNVQDHTVHFYHLHALDWVDVVSALSADPADTSALQKAISDWPLSSTAYFKQVQERLKGFVDRGQLGPFNNAYWGHPAYKLPPSANLMAVAHYLEALDWQREFIRMHAILGGKNPHLQSFLVGGMATPVDPDQQAAINIGTVNKLRSLTQTAKQFVKRVYLPDLLAIASFYKDWAAVGQGHGNYMAYGDYPLTEGPNAPKFIPRGIIRNKDLSTVEEVDVSKIAEYIQHSWYEYEGGDDSALHPSKGETKPNYTGPEPPYERLNLEGKYSWLKSPRYADTAMEVGPLARMLVGYASGHEQIKELVGYALGKLEVGPEALFSTLGRTAARGIEAALLVDKMEEWVDELAENLGRGELRIHDNTKWEPSSWPSECMGAGLHEAPRGALGHWVHIKDGRIVNYQCVVPSTWNAGPRDPSGQRGPYEQSLIGTPMANAEQPVEILRTVHSFDPCMACGVHVVDGSGVEIVKVRAQ